MNTPNNSPRADVDSVYEVTIACSAGKQAYAYTFTTRGPADRNRMCRALYYYDQTLFQSDLHRKKLLCAVSPMTSGAQGAQIQYNPDRASGALHESMIRAYKYILGHFPDAAPEMHIACLSVAAEKDVLVQSRTLIQAPALRKIDALPEPIAYQDVGLCVICSRVISTSDHHAGLCSRCEFL